MKAQLFSKKNEKHNITEEISWPIISKLINSSFIYTKSSSHLIALIWFSSTILINQTLKIRIRPWCPLKGTAWPFDLWTTANQLIMTIQLVVEGQVYHTQILHIANAEVKRRTSSRGFQLPISQLLFYDGVRFVSVLKCSNSTLPIKKMASFVFIFCRIENQLYCNHTKRSHYNWMYPLPQNKKMQTNPIQFYTYRSLTN